MTDFMSRNKTMVVVMCIPLLCLFLVGSGCPGPVGPEGPQGEPGDEGSIGWLYWEGEYSPSTRYTPGDAIQSNGSCYVCIVNTTGNPPPNATYWDLVAQRGEEGEFNEPFTFQQRATFNGGASFPTGTVDFSGSTVNGLPEVTWPGGQVANLATFNGGASFPTGTVDFSGSTVHGLPGVIWPGGPVVNLATFNGGVIVEGTHDVNSTSNEGRVRIESDDWPEIRMRHIDGGRDAVYIHANSSGNSYVELNPGTGSGGANMRVIDGCGRIDLMNSAGGFGIELDGCQPAVHLTNSQGQVTITLDGETGNIYYSGSLIQK